MKSKFLPLYESAIGRFTRGGVLVGDYVKFIDGYKNHEAYRGLANSIKAEIGNMVASGLNMQITNIKNEYPTDAPGDIANTNGNVVVDIAVDTGGGRYERSVTVPVCCLDVQDYYPNLAPIPDAVKRPNGIIIKPEELDNADNDTEMVGQTRKTMQGKKLTKTDLNLPVSYTAGYMS